MLFPGNRVLFMEMLTNVRWEDWDYEYGYEGNRFGCWGNGFTEREKDGRGRRKVRAELNIPTELTAGRHDLLLWVYGWKRRAAGLFRHTASVHLELNQVWDQDDA